MKIYTTEPETKKSWALRLFQQDYARARLSAVDSNTGRELATIIVFGQKQNKLIAWVKLRLEQLGYDPQEHGDNWDDAGHFLLVKE